MGRFFFLPFLCLAVTSCQNASPGPSKNGEDPKPKLEVKVGDGFRSEWTIDFASGFQSEVSSLRVLPDGRFWSAINLKSQINESYESKLELRFSNGDLLNSIDLAKPLLDIIVHESGQLTTFVKSPGRSSVPDSFGFEIQRRASDGRILHRKSWSEVEAPVPEGGTCEEEFQDFLWSKSMSFAAVGENVLIMAYQCRFHALVLLDRDLNPIWSKALTPQLSFSPGVFYGSDRVLSMDNGLLVAAIQADKSDLAALSAASGSSLQSIGKSDVVAMVIDAATGKRVSTSIVGSPNYDNLNSLVTDGRRTWIIGNTLIPQSDVPGDTWQSDLLIAELDVFSGEMLWAKNVEIDHEDWPSDVTVASGRLVVGGRTGARQVDSGSVVTYSKAFLLQLDYDGSRIALNTFGGERAWGISTIAWNAAVSQVLFGGVYDSPMTHSGDEDKSQLRSKSFMQAVSILPAP